MSKSNYNLTKYSAGSVGEIFAISYPLMISFLSQGLMLFTDRVILAKYDINAMNGAAISGALYASIVFFAVSIAAIGEVFVGQYNGDHKFKKISVPVWQMIWFCLFCAPIFFLIGKYGHSVLIPQNIAEHGTLYFKWVMYFGCLWPLIAALGSFYIGRGYTLFVTISAAVSAVANIFLDFLLVFGYPGFIPSMGAQGSAIATVISQGIQLLILFIPFLSAKNHRKYGTRRMIFDFDQMKRCLKIGTPIAFSHSLEVLGWAVLPIFLSQFGKDYITVYTVSQGVIVSLLFIVEGLSKGVTAVASNMIGSHIGYMIKNLIKSASKVGGGIILIGFFPLVVFPEYLVEFFLDSNAAIESINEVRDNAIISLRCVWLFFLFDTSVWIIGGVLTASGDTRFSMCANLFSFWVCCFLPVYLWFKYMPSTPATVGVIMILYPVVNLMLFGWRYLSGKWHKLDLSKHTPN